MAEPLVIEQRKGFGLASVMARRDVGADMLGGAMGFTVADGPRLTAGGDVTLIGTGPGTWLALGESGTAERMRGTLGPLASISDQSGGYVIFRLTGAGARTVLQRGAAIDLHPAAFVPGSVAVTVIAHIGVIFWQVGDLPAYDVAVFRSYSGSFRDWLGHAAAAL